MMWFDKKKKKVLQSLGHISFNPMSAGLPLTRLVLGSLAITFNFAASSSTVQFYLESASNPIPFTIKIV